MKLIRRFLLFTSAVTCVAGLICGVVTAKANTEHRMHGKEEETVIFQYTGM